jgi:hypothetical protein
MFQLQPQDDIPYFGIKAAQQAARLTLVPVLTITPISLAATPVADTFFGNFHALSYFLVAFASLMTLIKLGSLSHGGLLFHRTILTILMMRIECLIDPPFTTLAAPIGVSF